MDQLGIAQYITRVGLARQRRSARRSQEVLDGRRHLAGLRRFVEDSMVLRTPFELFVVRTSCSTVCLSAVLTPSSMTCCPQGRHAGGDADQFMTDWFAETTKWIRRDRQDRGRQVSAENKQILTSGSAPGAIGPPRCCRLPASPSVIASDELGRRSRPAIQRPHGQGRRAPLGIMSTVFCRPSDQRRHLSGSSKPSSRTTPAPSVERRPW